MKRLRVIGIVFAILLGGWFVWACVPSREPHYHRKALSQWLNDPLSGYGEPEELSNRLLLAKDAVRHMGTNAVPILLARIRATNSPLKMRINAWCWNLHLGEPYPDAGFFRRQGEIGFEALEPKDAQIAFPTLTHIMTNNPDPRVCEAAFNAMAYTADDDPVRYREILVQCAPLLPTAARILQGLDARTAFNATNRVTK
jgi:hypothetical protein